MGRDSPAQPGEPSPARQSRVLGHSHAQHSHTSVMGDLSRRIPNRQESLWEQEGSAAEGRTVLCPVVSRTCTWGTSGTSLLQDEAQKTPRAWWVPGESG